ncbi:MAG: peptidase M23 [bacterium P3]|nr:MAG: peptidase M23 [bacterium P3]KWW42752.1 MAG: peptidase M23 [bacterium F083]
MSRPLRPMFRLLPLLMLLLCGTAASAQSKTQLEKEKTKLEKEIKRLNAELATARKNTRLTARQLDALNKKIKERTRLINNINGQLNLLDIRIDRTHDSIAVLAARVDSLKAEYGRMTRVLYRERDRLSRQTLVFDHESYNRAYLRRKYFDAYSRYRHYQARNIRLREQELRDVSFDLERQRSEKNTLLLQEKKHKEALDREQRQKRQTQAASKQQEKTLSAQLSKKEKQKKQLQQQIQRIINEEVAKARAAAKKGSSGKTNTVTSTPAANPSLSTAEIALSNDFAGNKGKLQWPVVYTRVSREYGRYTHSSGGQNMNNGIDLLTASGSAVHAVFKGKVTRVFTCPNGTKGVIVRHGEYMTVYANLGSIAVREGIDVSTRQSLGTVYIADDNTSEFSFQIWKGQQSQNPRSWLRQ